MAKEDMQEALRADPGNPIFADYADSLREAGELMEALRVCLAGLEANTSFHVGRLALARVFFELGHTSFAIRELEVLRRAVPSNVSLMRLVERLSPEGAHAAIGGAGKAEVKAEAQVALGDLTALEDEE